MNVTRRILSVLLSFLLFTLTASAQKNMQPGYIVTLGNDTVKGYIDYRNWEKNPDAITFNRSLTESGTVYTPGKIKCFIVSNEIYETGIVTIDASPFKTENLTEGLKFNYITDTVFIQNLIKGDKNLYYYLDITGKEHFFIHSGTEFELLIYKRSLKRDDMGNLVIAEDKRFIGQLTLYLQGCQTLQSKLHNLKYDKKSMINLFLIYYKCSGTTLISQNKSVNKPVEFGVFAGMSLTKFDYFAGPAYLKDVEFPVSKNISGGLLLNFIFPRHFGRLSMGNELHYYSFKTESSYTDTYLHADTKIGFHYLQMNNMLRFKYPVEKMFLFMNAGTSVGFGFKETNYKKQVSSFQIPHETEGKAIEKLNKAYLGVSAGIGVKFIRYSFEIRYQSGFKKPDDINGASHPYSKTNSVFFLLGYQF